MSPLRRSRQLAQLTEKEAAELLMEKYKEVANAARVYAHASKREEFLSMALMLEHLQKQCARLIVMNSMKRASL
jgi:hypothetical protein